MGSWSVTLHLAAELVLSRQAVKSEGGRAGATDADRLTRVSKLPLFHDCWGDVPCF